MAESGIGVPIGMVVGNSSPHEFRFFVKSFAAKLGDLVSVAMQIPKSSGDGREDVVVWGRIVDLSRFNPFLPAEAGQELAEESTDLVSTVLSLSKDQVEGTVLVLGCTPPGRLADLGPLNYPVSPGAQVHLPPAESVKTILTGDERTHRISLGTLIGRTDVDVRIKTNVVVARHMALLAMTGGGKTVAARAVIRELVAAQYPLVIFDPHGDYLGLWLNREHLPATDVRLYYPSLKVKEENRSLVSYLVSQMTQGFTDPQKELYQDAIDKVNIDDEMSVQRFIDRTVQELERIKDRAKHPGTIPAIRRGLRLVREQLDAMDLSNLRLRERSAFQELPFEPMPDPLTEAVDFVRPGQVSIIYLGGYDHLTQSTVVAIVLKHLFEHRASLDNKIPPFLAVVEEAHNFIPSKGEGQTDTPSVETIRKVITEGRKFGTGLLLISQRPSRLDETALSQCNTFLILRLVNPRDQQFVEKVMENLSKSDTRLLPGFGPGQGIVSGQAVRFPLLIQVRYDRELEHGSLGNEDFLGQAAEWSTSPEAEAAERSARLVRELDDDATGGSGG